MKIPLCYYICCVLLFRYSIAAPPGPYRGHLPVNLNFARKTDGGGIIDHSRWKPPADPQHGASQSGQSLPILSRQDPSHHGLLIPRVQPASPDYHPDPEFTTGIGASHSTLRLPPLASHQQVGPPSQYKVSHQAGSSQVQRHHPYRYGLGGPSQRPQAPHQHNQQFDGVSHQQVDPQSHERTPHSSQAGLSQAQEQQAQDSSYDILATCKMCGEFYKKGSKKGDLRRHMMNARHIRQVDPQAGSHTAKTSM